MAYWNAAQPSAASPTPEHTADLVAPPAISNPRSLAGITPAWLTEVLRAHGHRRADVRSFDAEAMSYGRMSHVYRLRLRLAAPSDGPETVIVKLPGTSEHARQIGRSLGIYRWEADFYARLAPHVHARVPCCLYNGATADGEDLPSLLLEDVGDSVSDEQIVGASVEHAGLAIDWFAELHSGHWAAVDRRAECNWLRDIGEALAAISPLLEDSLRQYEEYFGSAETQAGIDVLRDAVPDLADVGLYVGVPRTVLLFDSRLDNLSISADGEVVGFDWSGICAGPGIWDVAYFLSGSLPTRRRRMCEADLVRRWATRLRAYGADPGTDAEALRLYRETTLKVGCITLLSARALDLSDAAATTAARRLAARTLAAVEDAAAAL